MGLVPNYGLWNEYATIFQFLMSLVGQRSLGLVQRREETPLVGKAMNDEVVTAQQAPSSVELKPGRTDARYSHGRRVQQPFRDSSHQSQ